MAKVSFTKLGLKLNQEIKIITYEEQIIEIKQYLPIQEKLELISEAISFSIDNNNFANPIKLKVFCLLGIVEKYTNITFTEKQKENPVKLYDLLISNNLLSEILKNIPIKEYEEIINGANDCNEAFYKYKNSIIGLLETITQDYSNINLDLTQIQQKLLDPEAFSTLKNLMEFTGLKNN